MISFSTVLFFVCCSVVVLGSAFQQQSKSVLVYHLINQKLFGETDGSVLEGKLPCPSAKPEHFCEFVSTDKEVFGKDLMPNLAAKFRARVASNRPEDQQAAVTLGLYSIHSWVSSPWPHGPDLCQLPTALTMAESEESTLRFKKLFTSSFPLYNGNSTTNPQSSVQRTYATYVNARASSSDFGAGVGGGSGSSGVFSVKDLQPVVPFNQKLSGAAYVASTCHTTAHSRPLREVLVGKLSAIFRVDSLGSCHRTNLTTGPSHVGAPTLLTTAHAGSTDAESLAHKQRAIAQYKFYLAFENTMESGYVTEKVFDALKAGTVPVYLGDSEECRKLLPHPNAAIYADDYLFDSAPRAKMHSGGGKMHDLPISRLAEYLSYLSNNETAYNEHLSWRRNFDPNALNPMLKMSWPCRVCAWASNQAAKSNVAPRNCPLHV